MKRASYLWVSSMIVFSVGLLGCRSESAKSRSQGDDSVRSNVEEERHHSNLEDTRVRRNDSFESQNWIDSSNGSEIESGAAANAELEIATGANLLSFINRSSSISKSSLEYIKSLSNVSVMKLEFKLGKQDIELCILRSIQVTSIGYSVYVVLQKRNNNYKLLSTFTSSNILDFKYDINEFTRDGNTKRLDGYLPDIYLVGQYRGKTLLMIPISSDSL